MLAPTRTIVALTCLALALPADASVRCLCTTGPHREANNHACCSSARDSAQPACCQTVDADYSCCAQSPCCAGAICGETGAPCQCSADTAPPQAPRSASQQDDVGPYVVHALPAEGVQPLLALSSGRRGSADRPPLPHNRRLAILCVWRK